MVQTKRDSPWITTLRVLFLCEQDWDTFNLSCLLWYFASLLIDKELCLESIWNTWLDRKSFVSRIVYSIEEHVLNVVVYLGGSWYKGD